jgi:F-type H+-transporting ATPase subunit epsilon
MILKIISAEDVVFSGEVDLVTLPGEKGAFTVLNNHASLISTLLPGKIVYDEGGKQNLVISADIALTNDNFMLSRADAEIALDLGGNVATLPVGISNTVSADYLTEGSAKTSDFNTLTSKNGVLNISNGTIMPGTNVKYGVAAIEKGTVNISNAKIVLDHTGAALRVLGKDAKINVSDTTLELTEAVGIEVGSGKATFDDVTVSVTANSYELAACAAASRAGTLTVEDGTYAAKGSKAHAVALYTTSGTININGGKFTSENGKVFAIWKSAAGVTHTINIKAGTFGSKTFSDFKTVDDWKAIFDGTGASYINENTMKKNADGSWTLTIAY